MRREVDAARGDVEAVIQRMRTGSKLGSVGDILIDLPDAQQCVDTWHQTCALALSSVLLAISAAMLLFAMLALLRNCGRRTCCLDNNMCTRWSVYAIRVAVAG